MGQNILMPPNVKGWDGGESWINANTVMLRFNFGEALATQRLANSPKRATWKLAAQAQSPNIQRHRRSLRQAVPGW
jgi:uncharacterized protein (DUF1800 family)